MAMSTGGGGVRAEPNVTPMIDVMLVLLIIFMVIIPTLVSGVNAQPPAGQNLKPHPQQDQDQLLGIDNQGQYFLNRTAIPNASLQTELTNIYSKRTEDKILYIKADKNLDYGKILDALDVAAKGGVRMTAMVTDQTPGTQSSIASDRIEATSAGKSSDAGGPH
ncbi:MAG: biopolymer transporter ExbD [Gemmatimonadota bacterium]|nr:biopolymer transporter ExbD [Gemmatimonadota bacterium]